MDQKAKTLRVIFAGTPEFAREALESIHAAGFEVALVLTQPDRPSGRGMKLQSSSVKQWALAHGVQVAQPRSLRLDGKFPEDAEAARAQLRAVGADAMVVAAYGLILPQWALDLPRLGCLNIHASLLPRWRGAAPIHRAVEAGDERTGVVVMQMDAGLDTGPMLLTESLAIEDGDTTGSLHGKLATLGGRLVVEALGMASEGRLAPARQPSEGACYARKIEKSEATLDWELPAAVLERRVRAFDPFPGASCEIQGEVVKVWGARVEAAPEGKRAAPGALLAVDGVGALVACGAGALRLTHLQRPGGKRMAAGELLRGWSLATGMSLARG